MARLLILLAVLAVVAVLAAWWRSRDGRVAGTSAASAGAGPVGAADVVAMVAPTTALTLVEFTAPDCGPCAVTKVLLDDVAATRAEVSVRTIDVADALDLARAHRIMRAPTTLLVRADGHLVGRVSGVPRRDALEALVDDTRERLVV